MLPSVPLAASFAGTRHPLRCAGSSGFPSLSLSPSPNSAPPCRSTFSFSFSPSRSVSCSLRYERAPSRSLPLSLFHFLPRSLERLSLFLSNIPASRSSLRLMFKLSLSLVHALSFSFLPSLFLSHSLVRRTRVLLAPLASIFLSPSIHIHVSTSFFFYPTVSSLARSSLLPRPNAWPKRKSVSLFSFLRTFTPVSPWHTNPTTFVEAVRDSQPNLRRRTLLAPTKPPPPLRALSTECFSRSLPSALLHTSFSLALTQSHLHPSTRKRTNPAGRYVSPLSSQVPLFRARCALFQF